MTLFNTSVPPPESPPIILHTLSREAIGVPIAAGAGGVVSLPVQYGWPSANAAIFIPAVLGQQATVRQLFVFNGTAASGTVDIGIYDENGRLLVSTGATTQSGTSVLQAIGVPPTAIDAGRIYLALSLSDTVGEVFAAQAFANAHFARMLGLAVQGSAHPLPGQATLAAFSSFTKIPIFGASFRASPAP